MSEAIQAAKRAVVWGCEAMCGRGYVLGTAGNISSRVEGEDLFVITPTSLPYEELTAEDLVVADMLGTVVSGCRAPSIECSMHRDILAARPDVHCIVHTHSKYATAAGSMRGISFVPVIDIETAMYIGGHIPVAPFAPPGSGELAESVAVALGDLAGVILEGHGAVGVGRTMKDAVLACDNVERNCEMFLLIRAAGEPKPLPEKIFRELCAWSKIKRGIVV